MPDKIPVPATPIPATPVVVTPSAEAAPVVPPSPAPVTADPAPAAVPPPTAAEAAKPEPVQPPAPATLLTKEPEKPAPPAATEAKPTPTAESQTPPAESAPVTYEAFKLPEGFEVDEKDMTDYRNILSEFKAPQELGQKLIDLYTRETEKLVAHQREQWTKTLDTWKNDVLSDPELGGNRLQTVLKRCSSVLTEFGSPELRQMLDVSGLGNHVEMVRFIDKVARFMSEPKPVPASTPAPQPKPSRAQRRYARSGA